MNSFVMNGYLWRLERVRPNSPLLIDRTGELRVATTDPHTRCVYISRDLTGEFMVTVLLHELGHCVMFSYDLLGQIHRAVRPEYWVMAEEWVCNFLADYGRQIFAVAYDVLGDEAWRVIPFELEQLIA